MATVIIGGTIVTATHMQRADVRIDQGIIAAIGEDVAQPDDLIVEAGGCYLFPGGIDPHTHFDLDVGTTVTADDFATGSRAALAGGTTTVIDFATQSKGGSLAQALEEWHRKAGGRSYVDYGFHLAICDLNSDVLEELATLPSVGVSSVKLYMAYKGILQVDDSVLLKVFQACKESGILVSLHCENGDIISALTEAAKAAGNTSPKYHALTRPIAVEREAVFRALCLAEVTGSSLYVVHVSSGQAMRLIRDGRQRGVTVYAETCPQYLLLDESYYNSTDFASAKYVMSPPLRDKTEQAALWEELQNGYVDVIGSDHCSFNLHGQKDLGRDDFSRIPNGAPGVENRFGLLYSYGVATGRIGLRQFVALTSTNAAKVFGLYPRKGTIAIGSDADIVVWEPCVSTTIRAAEQYQNVDYNAYEGFGQVGKARHVFLRGQHVVAEGVFCGESPQGKYLNRG